MTKTINTKSILEVAQRSHTAQVFLESLASRQHNRKETTVESVVKRFKAPRREVVDMFKAMNEIDLGKFVLGRRTQPSRFIWTSLMTEVGLAAIGEMEEIEIVDADELEDDEDALLLDDDNDDFDYYDHSFKLRSGFTPLTISLPKDLTNQEAERIAAFIKTLPLS